MTKTIVMWYYPINSQTPVIKSFKMSSAYPVDTGDNEFNFVFASGLAKLREKLGADYDKAHADELAKIESLNSEMTDDPEDDFGEYEAARVGYDKKKNDFVNEKISDNKALKSEWNKMFKSSKFPAHHFFAASQIVCVDDGDKIPLAIFGHDVYNEVEGTTTHYRSFVKNTEWADRYEPVLYGFILLPATCSYRLGENAFGDVVLSVDGHGYSALDVSRNYIDARVRAVFIPLSQRAINQFGRCQCL